MEITFDSFDGFRKDILTINYSINIRCSDFKLELPLKSYTPGFYLVTTSSVVNGFQF